MAQKLEDYYDKIMSSLTRKGTQEVDDDSADGFLNVNVSSMIYDRSECIDE